MAARKRTETSGSYTPREEQRTMPGLPSQVPTALTAAQQDIERIASLDPRDRLRQILTRWGVHQGRRDPRVPEGQMGLPGVSGLETPANQMDLFGAKPKR